MDKNRQCSKASLKLFEDVSSRETTPDPFSDDGEYGTDRDYDPGPGPCSGSDSDSSVSVTQDKLQPSTSKIETSASDLSEDSECSGSSGSIFDTREKKKQRRVSSKCGIHTERADTVLIESRPEGNLENDAPLTSPASTVMLKTPETVEINEYSRAFPLSLPPFSEVQNSTMPAVLPSHVENDNNLTALALPQSACNEIHGEMHTLLLPIAVEGPSTVPVVSSALPVEYDYLPTTSHLPPLPPEIEAIRQPQHGRRRRRTPSPVGDWENTTADIPMFEFDYISVGIQFEFGPNASVEDAFNKIFPPHIIDYIVTSTNEYGRALCSTNRPVTRHSRNYRYKDTNPEEMLKFLGLCLLMGQVNVPKKKKVFTYTDMLYYHPIFPYTMSARRFEQILRCLCVSERGAKGKDKIIKFIDAVTKNFRDCNKPTRELSLDESMLLFRGRLSFRQYIKSKKAKYGIKFYELTSSDGYVLNVIMYAGKDDGNENDTGKKTEKLVMQLMRPYLLKGHWLFMDNFYNSITLSEKLLDLKTHTTGTLRSNRKGNPKEIVTKKIKKGEHFWVRKNKVYVSKWQDKRSVLMVTTGNHPKLIEVSNKRGQKRMKPEEVSTYNQFMSGIDRADQMVSYYSTPRKTLRWYKKVFFHILDLAVWNSFYLYKKHFKNGNKAYEFITFREDLIKAFIKLPPNLKPEMMVNRNNKFDNRVKERSNFVQSDKENVEYNGHWPEKIPPRLNSKKTTYCMKCKMCSKKKIRRETSLRCKGCEEKPALCAVCFEEWHSQPK